MGGAWNKPQQLHDEEEVTIDFAIAIETLPGMLLVQKTPNEEPVVSINTRGNGELEHSAKVVGVGGKQVVSVEDFVTAFERVGHIAEIQCSVPPGLDLKPVPHAEGGLSHAGESAKRNDFVALRILLAAGANKNEVGKDGKTLSYIAAVNGRAEALAVLFNKGANVDIPDKDGVTPIIAATAAGENDAVRMLIEYGADVDKQDKAGRTPCYVAAENGYPEILRTLVTFGGADPERSDNAGGAPTDAAARDVEEFPTGTGYAMKSEEVSRLRWGREQCLLLLEEYECC
eukprot:Hpha_TRINITY_DN5429_c0_g1::TRINITY_DN5429_c0_g1_i1::g.192408::m.192408